ncbi:MAG: hypothetical protein KDD51_12365 [Bdellovibrionales bacterium]|nr:hypothetical protein [Bdellovibrionales bacterium]
MRKTRLVLAVVALLLTAGTTSSAAVAKNQRRLVLVSSLQKFGLNKYKWLYSFLDASTISMGQAGLGGNYSGVSVIQDAYGTKANFVNCLRHTAASPTVKAIDVVLSLHGADEKLYFHDGKVVAADLEADLKTIPNRSKLRLMYNLACYGSTHRNNFRNSGFRTAIGARKVNTASASEYPVFISRWNLGHTISSIFAQTNADPAMQVSDNVAKSWGFSDADSYKLISGTSGLTINSNAN